MTKEDIDALLDRGIDASFVIQLEKDIATERDDLILSCVGLLYGFWYSVPLADEWRDHTMAYVREERKYADLFLEHNALSVDWLTSQIADEAWVGEIDARLAERCPMTSANRLKGSFSTKEIEGFANSYNVDLMNLKSEMAEIAGVNQTGKYRAEDAYESENIEEYVNNRMEINGLPPLLPDFFWNDPIDPNYSMESMEMPEWDKVLVQDFMLFWKTGKIQIIKAMDTMDAPPDGYAIITRGVSREMVLEYYEYLDTWGITSIDTPREEGPLTLMFNYQGSVFTLAWEDGVAGFYMLKNPVGFMPEWYIESEN